MIIFSLFIKLRINLKFFKTYLNFFFVILLEQYVIAMSLIIVSKKLKIIFKFCFLITLKNLEHYLKLIDWLRNYIKRYAQKTKSFQRWKTTLLRLFFVNKNNQCKIYNQRITIKKSLKNEIVVYETLQIVFNQSIFLIYFNFDKILFINVDASKKLKFDIVIYYVKYKKKYRETNKLLIARNDMKFILFFSKYLTNVENCYWFTKLKIIDLIWFVRRIKHIIEIFVKSSIIIYTNHFTIVFIIQQIKLSSLSINKLNFCLIKILIYLL